MHRARTGAGLRGDTAGLPHALREEARSVCASRLRRRTVFAKERPPGGLDARWGDWMKTVGLEMRTIKPMKRDSQPNPSKYFQRVSSKGALRNYDG